ncbi:KilA-N domain-containing protein [Cupriavidus basilensis]|uniref:KilA-N domain-containing protein n=1 Tax=Cupriavidus basilensis TaxID=68895 RepID=UPI0039F7385A
MQYQLDLPVIPHQVEGNLIQQRAADGYINATAMCKAAKKLFGHYFEAKNTKEFLNLSGMDSHLTPQSISRFHSLAVVLAPEGSQLIPSSTGY